MIIDAMNVCIHLAFDGSRYCGFQVQPNALSVCEAVQDGLEAVLGTRPEVKGCSRTDSGVHALDYVLNFHADVKMPLFRLPLALNAHLPPDIRVKSAEAVPEDFHARYSAHEKTYVYRIWNSAIDDPFQQNYYYKVPGDLNLSAMQAGAKALVGTHDFLAFCAAGSSVAAHGDTVRTISRCTVERQGKLVTITVTADGYLYNMVRILAGTLLECGQGKRQPEELPAVLESRERKRAGITLPAKGLFLRQVEYPTPTEE